LIRTKHVFFVALTIVLLSALLLAQNQSVDDRWQALNDELTRSYGQKDWPTSLAVLDRMMKLADETKNGEVRGSILYMRGCIQALAGQKTLALEALRQALAAGFTDYWKYGSDTDLDPLRKDPRFKALLAEIKAKYGPTPIEWDRSRPAPEFPVLYDDLKDPQFGEMRREFAIDGVVAGAKDNFERLRRLALWVSRRWEHSPSQMASKSDPVTILREAQKGGRFICREYAIVMAGVASAYGMPSRVVNLLPREVETRSEAHSVAEVWLEELHKWVLADGQYGAIGELSGIPLSAVELRAAFAEDRPVMCSAGNKVLTEWKPFILRNAFYFKIYGDQRLFLRAASRQLILVPKGAPEPHKFAGGNEGLFTDAIYTSNPDSFYAPPSGPRPVIVDGRSSFLE
jgi:Transglutaminase-like superfamily